MWGHATYYVTLLLKGFYKFKVWYWQCPTRVKGYSKNETEHAMLSRLMSKFHWGQIDCDSQKGLKSNVRENIHYHNTAKWQFLWFLCLGLIIAHFDRHSLADVFQSTRSNAFLFRNNCDHKSAFSPFWRNGLTPNIVANVPVTPNIDANVLPPPKKKNKINK